MSAGQRSAYERGSWCVGLGTRLEGSKDRIETALEKCPGIKGLSLPQKTRIRQP